VKNEIPESQLRPAWELHINKIRLAKNPLRQSRILFNVWYYSSGTILINPISWKIRIWIWQRVFSSSTIRCTPHTAYHSLRYARIKIWWILYYRRCVEMLMIFSHFQSHPFTSSQKKSPEKLSTVFRGRSSRSEWPSVHKERD